MNTNLARSLIGMTLLAFFRPQLGAQETINPIADWVQIEHPEPFNQPSTSSFHQRCMGSAIEFGWDATAFAEASSVTGDSNADDLCNFFDAAGAVVNTTTFTDQWVYQGSKKGHLEGIIEAYLYSEVNLINADCGGISSGILEYSSNTNAPHFTAYTSLAAADTTSGSMGGVGFTTPNGTSITINVPDSQGVGTFPDEGRGITFETECINDWWRSHYTKSYMKWFADGWQLVGFFNYAEMAGNQNGFFFGNVDLSELDPQNCQ